MDGATGMIDVFDAGRAVKAAAAARPIEAVQHDPIAVAEVATA